MHIYIYRVTVCICACYIYMSPPYLYGHEPPLYISARTRTRATPVAPDPRSSTCTRKFECASTRSLEPVSTTHATCWRAGAGFIITTGTTGMPARPGHGRRNCYKIREGLFLLCAVLTWPWTQQTGAPLRPAPGRLVVWARPRALPVRSRPIARALWMSTSQICPALQPLPLGASRQVLLCIGHFSSLCACAQCR